MMDLRQNSLKRLFSHDLQQSRLTFSPLYPNSLFPIYCLSIQIIKSATPLTTLFFSRGHDNRLNGYPRTAQKPKRFEIIVLAQEQEQCFQLVFITTSSAVVDIVARLPYLYLGGRFSRK